MVRLGYEFYHRECLQVAHDLVGKVLVHKTPDGEKRLRITETEAYCGEADTACHAHKGRTNRTEVLYADAGTIYVYLCYGIHNLMNIVTGDENDPQAVLIRCCEGAAGPGRLTKALGITREHNRQRIVDNGEVWIEDDGTAVTVRTDKRVGIGYASQADQDRPWRFILATQSAKGAPSEL